MIDFLVRTFVKDADRTQDPAVRQRYGQFSGLVGIILNLLLFAGKFLAGVLTSSIAVTADAFNNLSDAGSSVVTLIGFHMAGQQADDDHPFGHGRIEYLAGLLVSLLILLVGLELGKTSVEKILHPEAVQFSLLSVAILAVSIGVKLWMARLNRVLGGRIQSPAMAATAADSLSDAIATGAVLLSTLIGHFFQLQIDAWVGILVALFILRAGWGAAKDTLDPLLGKSPDPELVRTIQRTVLEHPQVVGMHDLVIHDYGPGRSMMSFHAEVPMDCDIMDTHDAIDHIERELKEELGIITSIHMDPIATNDARTNEIRLKVAELVRGIDPALSIHDFRMTTGPQHTNLIFDVVVPHRFHMTDSQLVQAIQTAVAGMEGGTYYAVMELDRSYTE
jgi:cation diffusion facilitator family transporter